LIKVKEVHLFELLSEVDRGLIVIPDFQRDFIWKLRQIEELLNSVVKGYFIGSILLLESSLDNLRFAPRLIRGVDRNKIDRQGHNTLKYILDGQQRITSLYYAFMEPSVSLSEDVDFAYKFYIRPDNFDVFGLEDPEDIVRRLRLGRDLIDKLFEFYRLRYGIDIEQLPTMGIFRSAEAFQAYISSNPSLTPTYIEKLKELFQRIQKYVIPTIVMPPETPDEDIVNTFERINRTGTPLSIFELAVARYYPMGINLNNLKSRIEDRPFLKVIDEVYVLKVMALLNNKEPKPENLLRLVDEQHVSTKDNVTVEFNNLWSLAVRYLDAALDRIRKVYGGIGLKIGKRKVELIPYTSLLVPLAVMLYEINKQGNLATLYDKVNIWYWSSVFTQKYTHAVDTKSYYDVQNMKKWFENLREKPNFTFNFDYVKNEMRKAARTSALAKGFYNILILNNPRDLLTGQPIPSIEVCQIDHIFPSSRYGRQADNIFNLTLLDRETNQRKKDKLPSDFLNECLASHGNDMSKLKKTLESHFISTKAFDALMDNDLDGFIDARAERFIEVLKEKLVED